MCQARLRLMTQGTGLEHQESVGERIRRLRLARGLSQKEIAGRGISDSYVSRIESGQKQPSLRVLKYLASRLGVEVEYLESGRAIPAAKERGLRLADAELELRLNHDLDRADSVLRDLLSEDANDGLEPRIRSALGAVAARRGDYPEAIRQLEAVIESGAPPPPTHPHTLRALAP